MHDNIRQVLGRIVELEDELEALLEKQQQELRYHVTGTRVRFEQRILEMHRRLKVGSLRWLLQARLRHVLTVPIIYSLILPIALLDLAVTLYQASCFPVYRVPQVPRGRYVVLDRHSLRYLNTFEKLNCVYCGYAAGVLAYAREIAARTEMFWCPIKHARKTMSQHRRYAEYAAYGDAEAFRPTLALLRGKLAEEHGRQRTE